MLAWLMNLDFAGGDGSAPVETYHARGGLNATHRNKRGHLKRYQELVIALGVILGR